MDEYSTHIFLAHIYEKVLEYKCNMQYVGIEYSVAKMSSE